MGDINRPANMCRNAFVYRTVASGYESGSTLFMDTGMSGHIPSISR